MAKLILDHTQDTGAVELHRFNQLYEFPDFVKKADLDETRDPKGHGYPASVYADPRAGHMAYPCHTPASTYLSALYFAEKGAAHYQSKDAARVQQRLDRNIDYYGIRGSVDQMLAKFASMHTKPDDYLPDSDFAIVRVSGETGAKERHCRMKSAAEVKAAAQWLLDNRDNDLIYTDRRTIAAKILEKAARYGASLGEKLAGFVDRQAGLGICDPQAAVYMLQTRAKLAGSDEEKNLMTSMAEAVRTEPAMALHPSMLTKLAEVVDGWDRDHGLIGKYSKLIPRPEDALFSVTYQEVQASVDSAVTMTTGRIYDRNNFTKIALGDIHSLFGSSIADAVSEGLNVDADKMAEVAETLPRPDAELFERMLSDAGIPPISTKHANCAAGLSAFPLPTGMQLAGAY